MPAGSRRLSPCGRGSRRWVSELTRGSPFDTSVFTDAVSVFDRPSLAGLLGAGVELWTAQA